MSIAQQLMPEFDQEMQKTRLMLERVQDDKFDWRPHEKSYTMGAMASHIANLLQWAMSTMEADSFDVSSAAAATQSHAASNRDEALAMFDQNLGLARKALADATDAQLMANWTLHSGGQEIFTMPKLAVFRAFIMNHMIHHRAQLGVYLRMNDIPVPQMYGPTADESGV